MPSTPKPSQAIAFDLDGTIIDSIDLSARLVRKAASEIMGREFSEEEVKKHFGQPEAGLFKDLCPEPEAAKALGLYQNLLLKELSTIKIYPGMIEVLDELQKQIPLALYTSRSRWATEQIISYLDLAQYFKVILTGDDVSKQKPDAEGILKIAERLKIPASQMVYVGDSDSDVQAAKNSGALPLHVNWKKSKTLPYDLKNRVKP